MTNERNAHDVDEPADVSEIDPEPLDIDLEDVADALPHGKNPHPPSESDVQVPG